MRPLVLNLALLVSVVGLASCQSLPLAPLDQTTGGTGTQASPRPTSTPSASPSATPVPDRSMLKIVSLTIAPQEATLSVPPENPNLGSAGFPTTLQLDVRLRLEDGSLLDGDLVWTSSQPELLQVDSSGLVSTIRSTGGAQPSSVPVVLTATSRRDPTKVASVSVTVTDDATAIIQLQ
ncbi:MAG TPA: hypothetical protein V6D05_09900 [Stenomitos sp.]